MLLSGGLFGVHGEFTSLHSTSPAPTSLATLTVKMNFVHVHPPSGLVGEGRRGGWDEAVGVAYSVCYCFGFIYHFASRKRKFGCCFLGTLSIILTMEGEGAGVDLRGEGACAVSES